MRPANRELWILTYDQHGDQRILNFAKAFRAAGLRVKYFDPYIEFSPLPEGVKPVTVPFEETAVDLVALDANEVREMRNVVDKFSVSPSFACGVSLQSGPWLYRQVERVGEIYDLLRHAEGKEVVILDELKGWRTTTFDRPILEEALHGGFSLLANSCLSPRELASRLGASFPRAIYAHYDGPWLKIRSDDDPNSRGRYLVDFYGRRVRELRRYRRDEVESRSFFGLGFEYSDFRQSVYDFVETLGLVRDHLEEEGGLSPDAAAPEFVYVADLPVLPVAIMLKERFGTKVIIDCHEWWLEQEKIWNAGGRDRIAAIDAAERKLYPLCDARITVGDHLAEAMSRYFESPFIGMVTACPSRNTPSERLHLRARLGLPESTKLAIFQGSLTDRRNLDALAHAARYLAEDQRLVIVGGGAFRATMEDIARAEGAGHLCIFLGQVPHDVLEAYTLECDLGIIPYKAESDYYRMSMPNKLSEFHSAQIPLLVDASMSEIASIVRADGIGRVSDCSNPEELGRTMSSMLADATELAALRQAYTRAPARFSEPVLHAKVEKLIADLVT
jgi:glycosyltransferase involved in cell wall biosynthesis